MIDAYKRFFSNYANFNGRSTRSDYWYVILMNFLITFIIGWIGGLIPTLSDLFGTLSSIYSIAVFIPGIALVVRRLHDINKSGWFYLLELIPLVGSLIVLIFTCLKTVEVNNRWRMYDIQRGYIKDDLFDQPLSDAGKWTYKE